MNVAASAETAASRPARAATVERSTARLLAALVREPLSSVPVEAYTHDLVLTRSMGRLRVYLTGPDLIQDLFVRQADAIDKGEQGRVLAPALGTGLLTAEGADWRWQRRSLSPGFAHARLSGLVPAMVRAGEGLRDALLAASSAPVDIGRQTTKATLQVVGDTMLACAGGIDAARLERGIATFLGPTPWAIALTILGAPSGLPYPGKRKAAAAAREIRREVAASVAERRRAGHGGDDLLALLLAARDPESGRSFTDDEIVDNVVTFVTAGHETTSVALTWALHCLATQPDVAAKVRAEIDDVAGDAPLDAGHVARLVYLKQVVQETLRLYPPGPITSRVVRRPVELGGFAVPAKSTVILPIYAVHRHLHLWERPDAFDPERFAPEASRGRHRFAFLPFGVGPRICIGSAFAMLEATAILAVLVRALDVAPVGPAPIPRTRLTLRPRDPLMLRVSRRADRAEPGGGLALPA